MKAIGNIERRIDRLEEFTTLTAQETELLKTDVVDAATGLDRYKTGYVVEDMSDPFGLANVFSSNFRATMNKDDGILPLLEPTPIDLDVLTANSGIKNTGGVLTLSFTEKVFAMVGVSSRITNLNPFLVIKWDGRIVLTPPEDIWVEVLDRPEIIINRTEFMTVENVTWVDAPTPPATLALQSLVASVSPRVFGPSPPTNPVFIIGPAEPAAPTNPAFVIGPAAPPAPPAAAPNGVGSWGAASAWPSANLGIFRGDWF
jgi:hypothetical protein